MRNGWGIVVVGRGPVLGEARCCCRPLAAGPAAGEALKRKRPMGGDVDVREWGIVRNGSKGMGILWAPAFLPAAAGNEVPEPPCVSGSQSETAESKIGAGVGNEVWSLGIE